MVVRPLVHRSLWLVRLGLFKGAKDPMFVGNIGKLIFNAIGARTVSSPLNQ